MHLTMISCSAGDENLSFFLLKLLSSTADMVMYFALSEIPCVRLSWLGLSVVSVVNACFCLITGQWAAQGKA